MNKNIKLIKKAKDDDELIKLAHQVIKLREQRGNTDRVSVIYELSQAQPLAREEIAEAEQRDGDIWRIPWSDFTDQELQRKLRQYEAALVKKGTKKLGKKVFEELLNDLK